jgi:hypothetical protein
MRLEPDQRQLDLLRDHGRELGKQRGIDAAEHADRKTPGVATWQERAAALLDEWRIDGPLEFQSDQFVQYAITRGLPEPPDRRAFGAVITRAVRKGAITFVGYLPTPNAKHHGCPKAVWRWTPRSQGS